MLSHIHQNRHNNSTIMVLIASLLPSDIHVVISDHKQSRKDCMHQNWKPTRMQETVAYCARPLTTFVSQKRYKTHKSCNFSPSCFLQWQCCKYNTWWNFQKPENICKIIILHRHFMWGLMKFTWSFSQFP